MKLEDQVCKYEVHNKIKHDNQKFFQYSCCECNKIHEGFLYGNIVVAKQYINYLSNKIESES